MGFVGMDPKKFIERQITNAAGEAISGAVSGAVGSAVNGGNAGQGAMQGAQAGLQSAGQHSMRRAENLAKNTIVHKVMSAVCSTIDAVALLGMILAIIGLKVFVVLPILCAGVEFGLYWFLKGKQDGTYRMRWAARWALLSVVLDIGFFIVALVVMNLK